jgi:hypothetical protein
MENDTQEMYGFVDKMREQYEKLATKKHRRQLDLQQMLFEDERSHFIQSITLLEQNIIALGFQKEDLENEVDS